MKRLRHYIKANESGEQPSQAIFFDTETKPRQVDEDTVENVLWFGWAHFIQRTPRGVWCEPDWYRFETPAAFWRWATGKARAKTKLYLFCHNTNFDLPVLKTFASLRARGWKLHKAVIEGPPTVLEWRKGGATIAILDTLNWWRQPLKTLGESVRVPKLQMPSDRSSRAVWDRYARRDVEVISLAMRRWWAMLKEKDLGGFAPTIASQSFRIWRHRFMTARVLVHDDVDALRLERACYVGGRNEAFRLGKVKGTVYYVDFKSAYPSVMRDNIFPTALAGVSYGSAHSLLPLADRGYAVAAEVLVHCEEPVVPRLIDGKLCFPVGTFWTCLTGVEIAQVLDVGEIKEIGWSAAYHAEPLFRDFVDELFHLRLEALERGDECQAHFFKILLNSLYGKFGQNGFKWDRDRWEPAKPDGAWIYYDQATRETVHYRRLAGLTQCKRREPESRESVPIIAAYVTAYQRVRLLRLIRLAGFDNTLYCDTDGLLVTREGYVRLKGELGGHGLGSLELKGTATNTNIRGLKDYTFGPDDRTKGVRTNAEWLGPNSIRQQQWSGLKGQALRGQIDTQSIRMLRKDLSRTYTKGLRLPGGRVTPLRLDETSRDRPLPAGARRR